MMIRRAVLAVATVVMLIGCSSGDSDDGAQRLGEGDEAVVLGGDTPESFPDDIPLPEDAEFVYSDEEAVYHFNAPIESAEVPAFYEGLPGYELESSGDPIVDEATADIGGTIRWDGGELVYGAIEPPGTSALLFTLA
jgi:hypothetical protein